MKNQQHEKRRYIFSHQRLFQCGLKPGYLPESFSAKCFLFHGVVDRQGNSLAMYCSDYLKFKTFIKETYGHVDYTRLQKQQFIEAIAGSKIKVTVYFKESELSRYKIDARSFNKGVMKDTSGNKLALDAWQNCLVMMNDNIYVHPKVRAKAGDISADLVGSADDRKYSNIGISHSSFTHGNKVEFAGSLCFDSKRGWIIENTTGHYGTRATQMRKFLERLHQKKMDISQLTVKLWIPIDPKNPGIDEKDYTILYENAQEFLIRTHAAINFGEVHDIELMSLFNTKPRV